MNLQGKHILVVSSVYPVSHELPYGSFMHYRILHMQQKTQARFTVFAPSFKGTKQTSIDGVKVHRFRYFLSAFEDLTHTAAPRKLNNPIYIVISAFYILLGALQLLWTCYKEKPDLLWVHWPFPHALIAWPSHKLFNIPMVLTYYSAELLLARRFFFVTPILRWLTPLARAVTGNSEYTKKLTQTVVDSPVLVIPDGVAFAETLSSKPSSTESGVQAKANMPEKAVTACTELLCIASFIERKGVQYLLAALPDVLKSCSVRLRIIGTGPLESDLRQRCQELGLTDVVEFVGNLAEKDLANEYRNCDIVVVPSIVDSKGDTEGLGMIPIESMYFAKPAIACAVGGIVDIIRPDITGVLVPEKDPSALALAIVDLVNNPDKAEKLGKQGQRYYWNSPFSWSSIVSKYENVFSKAIDHYSTSKTISSLGK